MRDGRSILCSAALAAALILLPAPTRAGGPCRAGTAEHVPASTPQPAYRQPHAAGGVPRRLAGDAQYRLPDGAQYRLADHADYRLSRGTRSATPSPNDRPRGAPVPAHATRYRPLIDATARATGIEPELLHAVVAAESGYDPSALSPKGALGLMQLMPGTAIRYAVDDPLDAAQNLSAGARHLRYLLAEFNNDLILALAAYNAGESAVRKYGNCVPPYPETRAYVRRVLTSYRDRRSLRMDEPL